MAASVVIQYKIIRSLKIIEEEREVPMQKLLAKAYVLENDEPEYRSKGSRPI